MEAYKSLYLLQEKHRQLGQEALTYNHVFAAIEPKWRNHYHCVSLVRDLTLFFYYEEEGVLDPEMTMVYLLRKEAFFTIKSQARLARLKLMTKGDLNKSILAAVQASNLLFSILERAIYPNLSLTDQQFLQQFEQMDVFQLFSPQYTKYEDYPKKLVHLQTRIISEFKEYMSTYQVEFEQSVNKVVRFFDRYHLIEVELFTKNKF